jgi:hypothetical protein
MRNIFKHKHHFTPIRTIWPYPKGYGVYCKSCRTLVDSGLKTKEEAEIVCKDLNNGK